MHGKGLFGLLTLAAVAGCLLATAATAIGAKVICTVGPGKGQCRLPQNLAVDQETDRLLVADSRNHRIDVFGPTGGFEKTFGWGVKNGSPELQVCEAAQFSCQAGIEGSNPGQFSAPQGVAINETVSPHTAYVADTGNRRIQKLTSNGDFIWAIGGGVNKTTGADVCTAASGDVCGGGSDGAAEGEFTSTSGSPILLGVDGSGVTYVVDSIFVGPGEFEVRLQKFDEVGLPLAPQEVLFQGRPARALAVGATGEFWLTEENTGAIHKFQSDGAPVWVKSLPQGMGTVPSGLTVNPAGRLFVANNIPQQNRIHIIEYDGEGNILRKFGYGSLQPNVLGLAFYQSSTGDIYASEGFGGESGRVLHLDFPPAGPLVIPESCRVKTGALGNTKATLEAEINPEGKATTFHFEYVTNDHFLAEGFNNPTETPESPSIGEDFELHKTGDVAASAAVSGLTPEAIYHCRVIAKNVDGEATGQAGSFETKPAPEFVGPPWVASVTTSSAVIQQVVNPLGVQVEGHFDFVDETTFEASGFESAKSTPDVDFGSGEVPVTAIAQLTGLTPGTVYHYRLHAQNAIFFPFPLGKLGLEGTFTTFGPPQGPLPDGRAYELVSPAQKNSAEVAVPGAAGGLSNERASIKIQAGAGSGEAITYTSWTSFGDAQGAPIASQYLSRRGPFGWGTENISPFGFLRNPLNTPYLGFSPELSTAGLVVDEPPLAPGALKGMQNLYQRDNATGALEALTQEPLPSFTPVEETGLTSFCTRYAGSSADGSRSFFAANGAFGQSVPSAPAGTGFSLYERFGSTLNLISVLPNGAPAAPTIATRFGDEGGACSMDQGVIAHAVSADGSKVVWKYGGSYVNSKAENISKPLFARIDGTETIQLDAKVEQGVKVGAGPAGNGIFRGATPDGSKVFFTAPGKLLPSMTAEGALYRYDTEARTMISLTGISVSPEIVGTIGFSEDGTYAYFVAEAVLSGTETNGTGQKAEEGENNLYVWHEGEPIRFVGQLAEIDEKAWNSSPEGLTARVAPDGRHLAFLSSETKALAGYDNTVSAGEHCQPKPGENRDSFEGSPLCLEAFVYDAPAKALTCASCNPSGARPIGPAQLPGWSNPFEGPRYLTDDGQRLYFESFDSLVLADTNAKRDVYQFEAAGKGTCTAATPGYSPKTGGCVSLISTAATDHSYFLDASSDGRDVFFATRQPLVGWDDNPNYDVYDAREGGGFPEPVAPAAPCEGEGCKAPGAAAPAAPAPSTNSFNGPGNQKPKAKKKKKGKSKKHGKKKGKGKKQQGKKQKQKAAKKGRASR